MAANRFTGASNQFWNNVGNWSQGSVPISTDGFTVTFDGSSPNCTVNVAATCSAVDFTGFVSTITMTNGISVSGSVTLDPGMAIAGAGGLTAASGGTVTSNGKSWPNDFTYAGASQTFALVGDFHVLGTVTFGGTGVTTINGPGFNINCSGSVSVPGVTTGTATVVMNGTGTYFGLINKRLQNNLTFNSGGTITVSGTIDLSGSTVTYIIGTMVTTGSTVNINGIATTFNTSGMAWNNLQVQYNGGGTVTLTSDLNVANLTLTNTSLFNGLHSINVSGNCSLAGFKLTGTSTLTMVGTGTVSTGGGQFQNNNFIINTAGTVTMSGTIYFGGSNVTYVAGTVVTTGSTIQFSGNVIDTSTVAWNNVSFVTLGTSQLNSNMVVNGNLSLDGVINGFAILASSNVTNTGINSGTTVITMVGTGSISAAYPNYFNGHLTINTAGTITVSGQFAFRGFFVYTACGTWVAGAHFGASPHYTINASGFSMTTFTTAGNVTIDGTTGFSIETFVIDPAPFGVVSGSNIFFQNGNTYTINTALNVLGTNVRQVLFRSITALSTVFINLNALATQNVVYCNATDVDSSGGQTINVLSASTLTRTVNWSAFALTQGVVAYWNLDGNSLDKVGGFNGTDTNVAYSQASGKLTSGAGMSVSRISVSINSASPFRQNVAISYSLWAKMVPGGVVYMGTAVTGAQGSGGIQISQAGGMFFGWTPTGPPASDNFWSAAPGAMASGWHHFVFTMTFGSGSSGQWYMDGVALTTTINHATSNGIPYMNGVPYNGTQGDGLGTRYVNGFQYGTVPIDEVGVWNRALATSEVAALYNHGGGIQYPFVPGDFLL